MTLESPPFCPHCGEPLSPNVGYCPRCGKDVFTQPAPAEPAAADGAVGATEGVEVIELIETAEAPEATPEQARRRRRTALVAVGTVAALALGGTAWTMLRPEGDDDGFWTERLAQPAAVETKPDRAWTWEAGDEVRQVVTAGSTTYVVTRSGVTALDADGEAAWTSDLPSGTYVQVPGDHDRLFAMAFERNVVLALDAEDGSELWTAGLGDYLETVGDRVVVMDGSTLRVLDARTGHEQWTADTDGGAAVGPDAIYVVADDHLKRLDTATGDEGWSRKLDSTGTPADFGGITVADGFVVAAGTDEIRAFDGDSGAVRWTADVELPPSVHAPSTGLVTRSSVYVWGAEPGKAVVYDGHGRTGSLPAGDGEDDWFFAFPVHGDDGDYVVSSQEGAVYDAELEPVGTTATDLTTLSGDGLYEVSGRALSFTPFGATDPAWELDLGLTPSAQVAAGDRHVVVASGSTVTDYR